MSAIDLLAFLDAIDSELVKHADENETLNMYLLGRSSLVLGYGVQLMTKDVDVVDDHKSRLLAIAVNVFGKHAPRRSGSGLYLETVSSGLPPLPSGFRGRCINGPGKWRVIRPKRPEANDLVVTKLKRFHAGDREDIQILCDTGQVNEVLLRERFDLAHSFSDRDDSQFLTAEENLDKVADYLAGRRQML